MSISYIWALVGFSDANFAVVEVGEVLGRHWRHCGGFSLFVREYHCYGGTGENIEGDMECGGAHNLSLIGFGYFIVFCFLFYFLLFHDISPFVTYGHG